MHHKKRTATRYHRNITRYKPESQYSYRVSSAASRLVNNDTVPFGATTEACAECRLHVQRGVLTADVQLILLIGFAD